MATPEKAELEVLDDLRQKRLAYYATLNKDDTNSKPAERKCIVADDISKDHEVEKNNNKVRNSSIGNKEEPKTRSHQQQIGQPDTSHNNGVDSTTEGATRPAADFHKTSTFYVSNPSTQSENPQRTDSHQAMTSVHTTLNDYSKEQSMKTEGLDGYSETVERLIRATKEELLGMKSSDDIWSKIKQENIQSLNVSHQRNTSKDKSKEHQMQVKNQYFTSQSTDEKVSAKEILTKNNDNFEKQEVIQPTIPSSQYSEQHVKPEISYFEPSTHTKGYAHLNNANEKSLTTTKVEEIFSSRQYQVPVSFKTLQDSQDLDQVEETEENVLKSQAFSELELATHRPESERKDDLQVVADDLNLGDTVTKELRTVLGEEKFKEFLAKSRRDIDDLHERSSNASSRKDKTPRLIKDDTVRKLSLSSTHPKEIKQTEQEKDSPKMTNHQSKKPKSDHKEKFVSKSSAASALPSQPNDGTAENLINEYALDKPKDETYQGPTYKAVKSSETFVADPVKEHVIPKLDLEEVNRHEPPRPKLNRPKHEPPSIYQDTVKEEVLEVKERPVSGDSRLKQSNYEQVTVSRNVAFSADEIYNQAYGPTFQGQSAIMKQQYIHSNVPHSGSMQYSSLHGAPHSPTTPVGQHHLHRTTSYDSNIPMPTEGTGSYKQIPARHLSYSGEAQSVPHSLLQTSQGVSHGVSVISSSYGQIYTTPDMQMYDSSMGSGQAVRSAQHVPHPPAGPSAVPLSPASIQPVQPPPPYSAVFGPSTSVGGVLQNRQGLTPMPRPPTSSSYQQMSQSEAFTTNHAPAFTSQAPVFSTEPKSCSVPVSMATQTRKEDDFYTHAPQTPTTSNAEVQTDREEIASPELNDKGLLLISFARIELCISVILFLNFESIGIVKLVLLRNQRSITSVLQSSRGPRKLFSKGLSATSKYEFGQNRYLFQLSQFSCSMNSKEILFLMVLMHE